MEMVPKVLSHYGKCLCASKGSQHLHQALPRLLTVYFEWGSYCTTHRHQDNRVRARPRAGHLLKPPGISARRAGLPGLGSPLPVLRAAHTSTTRVLHLSW